MIQGTGIDIVNVARLSRWKTIPGLCERWFTEGELSYSRAKSEAGAAQSLAARFAAKEAFGKALGTGLRGFSLKEVEVVAAAEGMPQMKLSGKALSALRELGGKKVFLSLSHEKDIAAARVVIEG
jgi:holo-[acyl-carrier protein] synthase